VCPRRLTFHAQHRVGIAKRGDGLHIQRDFAFRAGRIIFDEGGLAKLLAAKAIERGKAPGHATSAERTVLGLGGTASWRDIRSARANDARWIDETLTGYGLLMEGPPRLLMRLCQVSPYVALLIFGAIKWDIGVMRDKPIGLLTAFLVVTLILALIRYAMLGLRTRAGIDAYNSAKAASDRLQQRRQRQLEQRLRRMWGLTGRTARVSGPT
jgi:uncharacterized protein (TIGR04222 family)